MRRIAPILSLLAFLLIGCPDNREAVCAGVGCPTGQVCDIETGQCRTQRLDLFDGPLPGRGVEIDAAAGLVFMTAVDPITRSIIAGVISRDDRDVRVLMATDRIRRKLAIDATNDRVAVAWLGDDNTFRIAWRGVRNTNAFWNFVEVESDRNYSPTQDFDIALAGAGVRIAYRTIGGNLELLEPEGIDGPFKVTTVDDGGTSANGVACPTELRSAANLGVGREPDLRIGPDREILISYQDEDCGDLRLARRLDGQEWVIDVVDTGEFETQPNLDQRGRVGRYSSVALTPTGRVALAYFDTSRRQLRFARSTDRGWEIEVVDPGVSLDALARDRKNIVGTFAVLSFDERGVANITYQNASTLEFRRASRNIDSTRWVLRTIANDGIVGFSGTHTYSPETGLVAAAERIDGGSSSYRSLLEVVWD